MPTNLKNLPKIFIANEAEQVALASYEKPVVTLKTTAIYAHLSDFEKQAVRSPIIRGIAVGAATVTIATGAAVVAESAAAIIPQTAAALAPQAATILSSPAVQKSAAVGAGFLYSKVTEEVQDLPTLNTGIPTIDNGFQIGLIDRKSVV